MKTLFKNLLLGIGIIAIISLLFYLYFSLDKADPNNKSKCFISFGTVYELDSINKNENDFMFLKGLGTGIIGTSRLVNPYDTSENKYEPFFLTIPFLHLKKYDEKYNGIQYYYNEGKPYVKHFAVKKNIGQDCDTLIATKKYIQFAVDKKDNTILIPTTKIGHHSIYGLAILIILFYAIFIGYIIGGIRFLISVSRGKVFTPLNIMRLKNLALFIIFTALLQILIIFSIQLIFNSQLNDFVNMDYSIFWKYIQNIGWGIVAFIIYKAFEKGYKLQQENDLTV